MSLDLTHVGISAGDTAIVHDVSLSVQPGSLHILMGPNGSGKSTLATALAGHPAYTLTPQSQITLNSVDLLNKTPDERARLGLFLAFQQPVMVAGVSIWSFLRALWEARFGPLAQSEKKPAGVPTFKDVLEWREWVGEQAVTLGLKPELFTRHLNDGFSGGEKKRLEMLQLRLFRPQYAWLDETDSGLDVDALQIIAQHIESTRHEFQTGTVVITHYQRLLDFLQPDAIHILVKGSIVKSGGAELAQYIEKNGYKEWL